MSFPIFCAFGIFGCMESKTTEQEANYIETESALSQANVSSTVDDSAESIKNVRAAGEKTVATICGTTSSTVGEKIVTQKEIMRMGVINAKLKHMPEARKA